MNLNRETPIPITKFGIASQTATRVALRVVLHHAVRRVFQWAIAVRWSALHTDWDRKRRHQTDLQQGQRSSVVVGGSTLTNLSHNIRASSPSKYSESPTSASMALV